MLDTNLKNDIEDKDNINNLDEENAKVQNKQKRFTFSSLATMFIILLLAVVSVGSYLPIRNSYFPVKDNAKIYMESDQFVYRLSRLTLSLQHYIRQTDDGYDDSYVNVKSVKYQISSSEDGVVGTSNMADITDNALQKEIKDGQFYMRATFDENGNPTIESSLGSKFNKDSFIRRLTHTVDENMEVYSNLDILYIVPQDFDRYDDVFATDMKNYYTQDYTILILVIGAVSVLILIIVAFSMSYSLQKNMAICKVFNKMFLEFKILTWIGFFLLCVGVGIGINRYSYYGYDLGNLIYNGDVNFYLIGIPVTFLLYSLIYLSVVYIKYIYHKGFKEGIIRNSIGGRIALYILSGFKRTIKSLIEIDLREDSYRKLMVIVGINLLALWVISIGRFLGFIFAIVYSIFLFKYLLELLGKIRELNDASIQVAEGNFDINLDENMGVLSPIAKNLNNIKDGFQLAVDEEIKSQRMKSELITNVSHDLKTPLTSIITYVDLLKNEDITEANQKEYINILDKKSERLKILIEDLFEASKATSGNIDLHFEKVDVIALFRQTMGELEEKINTSNLQIKLTAPENKIICELDGKRTYRIFENIMTNILKYSMPNSRVYIDIGEDQQEVSFIFKNISAYEMNFDASEIIDRFTRGDKSRNTEGSGLGLSIAKSLIELQNGEFEITIDGDLFKQTVKIPKLKEI